MPDAAASCCLSPPLFAAPCCCRRRCCRAMVMPPPLLLPCRHIRPNVEVSAVTFATRRHTQTIPRHTMPRYNTHIHQYASRTRASAFVTRLCHSRTRRHRHRCRVVRRAFCLATLMPPIITRCCHAARYEHTSWHGCCYAYGMYVTATLRCCVSIRCF